MSPHNPPHPCAIAGCPHLVKWGGGSYCPTHTQERAHAYDAHRGSAAARGYGHNWRKIRAMKLNRDPLCEDPFEIHGRGGQDVEATEVDHIVPRSAGGSDRMDNLQSLCKSCHSKKTAREDGGFGTQRGGGA